MFKKKDLEIILKNLSMGARGTWFPQSFPWRYLCRMQKRSASCRFLFGGGGNFLCICLCLPKAHRATELGDTGFSILHSIMNDKINHKSKSNLNIENLCSYHCIQASDFLHKDEKDLLKTRFLSAWEASSCSLDLPHRRTTRSLSSWSMRTYLFEGTITS